MGRATVASAVASLMKAVLKLSWAEDEEVLDWCGGWVLLEQASKAQEMVGWSKSGEMHKQPNREP